LAPEKHHAFSPVTLLSSFLHDVSEETSRFSRSSIFPFRPLFLRVFAFPAENFASPRDRVPNVLAQPPPPPPPPHPSLHYTRVYFFRLLVRLFSPPKMRSLKPPLGLTFISCPAEFPPLPDRCTSRPSRDYSPRVP